MTATKRESHQSSSDVKGFNQEFLQTLVRRHLKFGWIGMAVFIGLGIALEAMHALKIPEYLSLENSARRLMWTLAHAHGTLFSLVLIALGLTIEKTATAENVRRFLSASRMVHIGWIFMPLGFFLGGVQFFGGDPGWGIFLVPVGAFAMLMGIIQVVRSI